MSASRFTWYERSGFGPEGDRFHCSYLVDGGGRCWARVDHPLTDYLLYVCFFYFGPDGDNPKFEDERAYVELEAARRYCEAAAAARIEQIEGAG